MITHFAGNELAPVVPEIGSTERAHYFPIHYINQLAHEQASQKRNDVWRNSAGQLLSMEPQLKDGQLQINVSDAEAAATQSTPKPWEVVVTSFNQDANVRAEYFEKGTTRYSMIAERADDGTLEWGQSLMEWRYSTDYPTDNKLPYLVKKFPATDEGARVVANMLSSTVHEVADRYTELMVIQTRIALPLVELETVEA